MCKWGIASKVKSEKCKKTCGFRVKSFGLIFDKVIF